MILEAIFGLLEKNASNQDQTVKIAGANAGSVTTTEKFSKVTSITLKDGNGNSASGQAAAGVAKA